MEPVLQYVLNLKSTIITNKMCGAYVKYIHNYAKLIINKISLLNLFSYFCVTFGNTCKGLTNLSFPNKLLNSSYVIS